MVNMTDTDIFNTWCVLHNKRIRELRDKYESDTGKEMLFTEFALLLYLEAQDLIWLNYN